MAQRRGRGRVLRLDLVAVHEGHDGADRPRVRPIHDGQVLLVRRAGVGIPPGAMDGPATERGGARGPREEPLPGRAGDRLEGDRQRDEGTVGFGIGRGAGRAGDGHWRPRIAPGRLGRCGRNGFGWVAGGGGAAGETPARGAAGRRPPPDDIGGISRAGLAGRTGRRMRAALGVEAAALAVVQETPNGAMWPGEQSSVPQVIAVFASAGRRRGPL